MSESSERTPPPSGRPVATVLLGVAATLFGLLLLEAGFRVRAHVTFASLPSASTTKPKPGTRVRLGDVVRRSPNSRIVYELVPDLDVEFLGTTLRTNASGFRGSPIPQVRSRPAVRIVGLGDSVLFGWGVREEDSFLERTAALLSGSHPGVAWEVINTAVPGYNTVMEVETLETKGLSSDPDIVVLSFVGNDLGLPNFIEDRPSVLTLRRSFLLAFLRARLGGASELGSGLVGVSREQRRAWAEADPASIPPTYRAMVGPQAWRGAMDRLASLSRTRGFAVVVVVHPVAPEFVREATRDLGFPLVETDASIRAWARSNGIEDIQSPPLTLTDGDPHPSALGHDLIARTLAVHFTECGLADRLAARRR